MQETIQLLADSDVSNVEDLTEAAKNHVFDYTFVDNENLGSITRWRASSSRIPTSSSTRRTPSLRWIACSPTSRPVSAAIC